MPLNRSRYVPRDFQANTGTREGDQLGLAIARIADRELLEALVNVLGALNEFGGEVFIGADRQKLDKQGKLTTPDQPGAWTTIGYVVAFNSRARIKGTAEEPESAYGTMDAAEPFELPEIEEPVENGAGDLEAAEALRGDS